MSTPHEFSIPVRDLDAAGRGFRFAVRPAWLRGAFEGTEVGAPGPEGELDLRLSKSGNDVVVHGTLTADLSVPCARCLAAAHIHVHERISALAVPAGAIRQPAPSGDEPPDAAADADMFPYDGETVVLDDLVRDELMLAIPMIPLCSEACPGIRPKPSEDEAEADTIDPRLRPLLRLKKTT
jgi:uncharacterized protein